MDYQSCRLMVSKDDRVLIDSASVIVFVKIVRCLSASGGSMGGS